MLVFLKQIVLFSKELLSLFLYLWWKRCSCYLGASLEQWTILMEVHSAFLSSPNPWPIHVSAFTPFLTFKKMRLFTCTFTSYLNFLEVFVRLCSYNSLNHSSRAELKIKFIDESMKSKYQCFRDKKKYKSYKLLIIYVQSRSIQYLHVTVKHLVKSVILQMRKRLLLFHLAWWHMIK